MLTIDGSLGEGGGQIVRSSLAIAALRGKAVRISNIRAGRAKPGLMRQHLAAVRAIAEICQAKVEGDELSSTELSFSPSEIRSGEYQFRIGSAGSTTLVLQTILPALCAASAESKVTIEGGTHNPLAPPFDFLQRSFLPQLRRFGPSVDVVLKRYGFMPSGGGRIEVDVTPSKMLHGLDLVERGASQGKVVRAVVAQIDPRVADRELDALRRKANWDDGDFQVVSVDAAECNGAGNAVVIELCFENVTEVIAELGRVGVRAEHVARSALKKARSYLSKGLPVGPYLADQLLLPMGIAAFQGHTSRFRTGPLTQHSKTHIELLRELLGVSIEAETVHEPGATGDVVDVTVQPA
ncbi:MAG: RNA 3'-terminal phosphate cyclase [Aureliella sp.]